MFVLGADNPLLEGTYSFASGGTTSNDVTSLPKAESNSFGLLRFAGGCNECDLMTKEPAMESTNKSLPSAGGEIASIAPNSLGDELGLRPGDWLLAINGHILRDVIDCRYYSSEEYLEISLNRDGVEMTIKTHRRYGQELGLEFIRPIFDATRRCVNVCEFCFVAQLPGGLRASLYIRDDDYRLSFLTGSFVTLTNLSKVDWDRLAQQRLSPLYVSVHATAPYLRRRILGHPVPDIRQQLRRLGDLGIHVHTQVVLVPGLNDGLNVERTLRDLAALYPMVESVAVVPVGLTRFHRGGCRTYRPGEAKALLAQVAPLQREFRQRWGVGFMYLADEWYLLAKESVPPTASYDGFPQLENGVGLVREFLDDWEIFRQSLTADRFLNLQGMRFTLVCGVLIAPKLRDVANTLSELTGSDFDVISVPNMFFGPTVTVSGLLAGADVVNELTGRALGNAVVLPRAMFDAPGECTLDGWSLDRIEEQLNVPVRCARNSSQVIEELATLHS